MKWIRLCLAVVLIFMNTTFSHAQTVPVFPEPALIGLSEPFVPVMLKGLQLDPDNPLKINFLFEYGTQTLDEQALKKETEKLISYFLTSLTLSEQDIRVDLSVKNVLLKASLKETLMGRDLVAQDYLLKLLTASLMHPEAQSGTMYWDALFAKIAQEFETAQLPSNTFTKICFVPGKATVFQQDDIALVAESRVKMVSQTDTAALNDAVNDEAYQAFHLTEQDIREISEIGSAVFDDVLIPVVEKEVNEGRQFAVIRQIYQCFVLATWYKETLQDNIMTRFYADQYKISGQQFESGTSFSVEDIHARYVQSLADPVYHLTSKMDDPVSGGVMYHQVSGGGILFETLSQQVLQTTKEDPAQLPEGAKASLRQAQHFQAETMLQPIPSGEAALEGLSDALPVNLMRDDLFQGIVPQVNVIQPVNIPMMIGL